LAQVLVCSHESEVVPMVTLRINGRSHQIDVPSDMPVLWVLRDVLGMTGTKFGCGMALCGACTEQLGGQAIRSCVTPVSAAAGKAITTIEAIGATAVGKKVQEAWIALDVPQCGYRQSGQIMSASALNNAIYAATGKRLRKLPLQPGLAQWGAKAGSTSPR
jgi:isoquinoline 1-oxidoreductase subunit alpha